MNSGRRQFWMRVLFGAVLLDSMVVYLLQTHAGVIVPINAILPLALFAVGAAWGFQFLLPPVPILGWMCLMSIGFMLGIGLNPDIPLQQLLSLAAGLAAFVVGYASQRWTDDSAAYGRLFLLVGGLYVTVCVLALVEVVPAVFPIIESEWASEQGFIIVRPEVTTDQNFQIFYLLTVPLIFALPFRLWRFSVALILTTGAVYTLARLQTRSGLLVFTSAVLMAWLAPLFTRGLGRFKIVLIPFVFLAVIAANIGYILDVGAPIIERFTSEQAYVTVGGRVLGAQYLFEHILSPSWWIARGNREFLASTGNLPHFNPTALFLQGGLPALVAWVALVAIPIVLMGIQFLRRQLDGLGTLIFIAGAAVFVSQLALNHPTFEQVWLWAGAVVGTQYRLRRAEPAQSDA